MGTLPTALVCAVAAVFSLLGGTTSMAQSEKRFALIIGNNDYRHVSQLSNPRNDANDMAASLERLGFTVRRVTDGTYEDMRRALIDFNRAARGAQMAIIYFAGHGIEVGGENWLIPVDAELKIDADVEHESVGLKALMVSVATASHLGLVILDACRNNPFDTRMQRTIRTRSVTRGLAAVEPTGNVLVAFAAKEGTTAADGTGRNSPFTGSLIRHLETPGLEINFLFRNVRDDVVRVTNREQQPFVYGSLSKDAIYLKPPVVDPIAEMRRDFELAAQSGTKPAWNSFLEAYPKGLYSGLARAALAEIEASEKAERLQIEAAGRAERARMDALEEDRQAEIKKSDADRSQMQAAQKLEVERRQKEVADRAEAEHRLKQTREKAEAEQHRQETDNTIETDRRRKEGDAENLSIALGSAGGDRREMIRSLQTELRRVGCYLGVSNGSLTAATLRAVEAFNRSAGLAIDVKDESEALLQVIRSEKLRVCPLVCERGFRPEGERCIAIICGRQETLGDDGICRKKPTKAAAKPQSRAINPPSGSAKANQEPKPSARRDTQGVVCDQFGCRSAKLGRANPDGTVPKGCRRVEPAGVSGTSSASHGGSIVCD